MKTAPAENSGHLLSLAALLNTGKADAAKSSGTGRSRDISGRYSLRPHLFTSMQLNAAMLAEAPVPEQQKQDLLNLAQALQPLSLTDTENLFQSILNKIQNSGAFFRRRSECLVRALRSMPITSEQREMIVKAGIGLLISSDLRALVSRVLALLKENRALFLKQYRKQAEQLRKACVSMKKFIDSQDRSSGIKMEHKEEPLLFALAVKELNQPLFVKAHPEQQKDGHAEPYRKFDFLVILDSMGSIRGRISQAGGAWSLDLFAEQDRVKDFLESCLADLTQRLVNSTVVSSCRVYTEPEPIAGFFSMNEDGTVLPSVDIKV